MTGTSPSRPSIMRLPGSTGMPRWRTSPPAETSAAGMTSPRSTMADAPKTRMGSTPLRHEFADCCAHLVDGVVHYENLRDRAVERRDALAHGIFRLCDERRLGLRQARDDESGPLAAESFDTDDGLGSRRSGRASCKTDAGTAKGMTLTVATISRRSTTAYGATVASVRLSCRRLSAETLAVSTMAMPLLGGMEIGASRERRLGSRRLARDDLRHGCGSLVLRHIIRCKPRSKNPVDAGRSQEQRCQPATAPAPS